MNKGSRWTDEETRKLEENYLDKSLEDLVDIIGRSGFGLVSKLQKLAKENPDELDMKRVKDLSNMLFREYQANREQYKRKGYLPEQIAQLKTHYMDKSAKELAELIGKGRYSIVYKLRELAEEKPRKWDINRVKSLHNELAREYSRERFPRRKSRLWTEEEIQILKENYLDKSSEELSEIIGRGKYGVVGKLKKLHIKIPDEWDIGRIRALYSKLMREYMQSHPEKQRDYDTRRKTKENIYHKFLEREKEWNERDLDVLRGVYSTHNWMELTKIFRLKKEGVHVKLRALYEEDESGWDLDRIVELENESKKYSLEDIRREVRYYAPARGVKNGLSFNARRPELDELIEQGNNMNQIGKKVKLSRERIRQYINSRDLREWYDEIQKKKRTARRPEFVELIEQGLSEYRIGKNLDISTNDVTYYINSRGLRGRYSKIRKQIKANKKPARRLEIDELIEQGLNMNQIGRNLGIRSSGISKYVKTRDLHDWYFGIQKKMKGK